MILLLLLIVLLLALATVLELGTALPELSTELPLDDGACENEVKEVEATLVEDGAEDSDPGCDCEAELAGVLDGVLVGVLDPDSCVACVLCVLGSVDVELLLLKPCPPSWDHTLSVNESSNRITSADRFMLSEGRGHALVLFLSAY